MDYHKKKCKKINLKQKKDCAMQSLKEVNCFWNNFSKIYTIKKIIKK